MNDYKVSIVIPNYNGKALLEKNLPKLFDAVGNINNKIVEVIIVDDASKDDSTKFIKKTYPDIKLIKHTKNRGFSSSVNTGVRTAKGNLVVLLNSDVIPDKDFLEDTLPIFSDEKVFGVSFHEKGYSWAKGTFNNGFLEHSSGKETKAIHPTLWISGGSGIFRRDVWHKLGGMDEKLFSPFYWEDIDLSFRALKRGYKVLWNPDSIVSHEHESTISKLSKSYVARVRQRNELLFIWKNITSKNLINKHVRYLFLRVFRHPGYIRIVFMAIFKLGLVLEKRKKEIKESKISDEAIFARF
jgi:GT2 family glycosyltransferase